MTKNKYWSRKISQGNHPGDEVLCGNVEARDHIHFVSQKKFPKRGPGMKPPSISNMDGPLLHLPRTTSSWKGFPWEISCANIFFGHFWNQKISFCCKLSFCFFWLSGSVFKIYIWNSVFRRRKNGREICFLVSEILNKYKRYLFLDALYYLFAPKTTPQTKYCHHPILKCIIRSGLGMHDEIWSLNCMVLYLLVWELPDTGFLTLI